MEREIYTNYISIGNNLYTSGTNVSYTSDATTDRWSIYSKWGGLEANTSAASIKWATTDTVEYSFGGSGGISYWQAREETEEEKAARLVREEIERKAARDADRKARRLFARIAGLEAYRMFLRKKYLDVVSRSGVRYRLKPGEMVRVMEGSEGDKVLHKLCAYIPDVPQFDTFTAQYLSLMSGDKDEEDFKKVAIKHAA